MRYILYSDWQARANSVVLTRRRGKTASYWTYAVCIKYRIFTPSIWTGKYELRVQTLIRRHRKRRLNWTYTVCMKYMFFTLSIWTGKHMLTVKILIRRRLSSIYILRGGSCELSLLSLIKLRPCTLFVLSRWKEGIS